jgi:hypothetical protein
MMQRSWSLLQPGSLSMEVWGEENGIRAQSWTQEMLDVDALN